MPKERAPATAAKRGSAATAAKRGSAATAAKPTTAATVAKPAAAPVAAKRVAAKRGTAATAAKRGTAATAAKRGTAAVATPTLTNRREPTGRAPAARIRASEPRRVGIMGGTFDPIHHGHLVAASEVASRFLLDEVVFVPTGEPWQKESYSVSAAEDRYLMTVIATASNPSFQVSRADIDRAGQTYTVDTLRELKGQYGPKVQLFFITGADALGRILSWKDPEQLFDLAHFVGVTRPGFELTDEHLPADAVSLVQVPAMAISSTDCRSRVANGLPIWYLVPDGVVRYIAKRHLYR